jgi:hypothetical protein
MAAPTAPGGVTRTSAAANTGGAGIARRLATETKAAFKTTEFWSFLGVVAAILVSAALIKGGDTGGTDEFIARQAWLYVAIVTGAYLISRGLAKAGTREPYWDDSGQNRLRDGDNR